MYLLQQIKVVKENITSKTYDEYGIDLAAIEKLKEELENQVNPVKEAQDKYRRTLEELKRESLKVDEHSIDIDLVGTTLT